MMYITLSFGVTYEAITSLKALSIPIQRELLPVSVPSAYFNPNLIMEGWINSF